MNEIFNVRLQVSAITSTTTPEARTAAVNALVAKVAELDRGNKLSFSATYKFHPVFFKLEQSERETILAATKV